LHTRVLFQHSILEDIAHTLRTAKLCSLHDVMHFSLCILQCCVTLHHRFAITRFVLQPKMQVILTNTKHPNTHVEEQSRIILFKGIKHGFLGKSSNRGPCTTDLLLPHWGVVTEENFLV